ncbi:MAG: HPr family phosphocarrier protein [Lachnospiraceae bacterium]|nr:HPr family phosphocarrier protein [Lachnospiraceae bacterium]
MEYNIMLRPSEVRDFVEAATRSDCYIDVSSNNHFIVDAKSILGVLGLDLNKAVKVKVHGYDKDFEHSIRRFSLAC